MCGIAGFSLSADSKIKTRKLANALLTSIEDRGSMASGYASQALPKDARHVILHTRLATHGSTQDNRNNHPVLSPSEDIALVHNGVIYNHHTVRKELGMSLPDVDTSVIPAVIEQWGLGKLDTLDGDAAIAWFNRHERDTLHVARYQHSPLVLAQVEDGSFIFCSTEALLWKALIALDLTPTWMQTVEELDYFTVKDGVIIGKGLLPEPTFDSAYDYNYYRHQTAGAKSKGIATSFGDDTYWTDDDYEDWEGYNSTSQSSASEDGDTLWDDDAFPQRVKYFAVVYDKTLKDYETLYYYENEKTLWQHELFMLANEDDLQLFDYGHIVKGELISLDSIDI